MARGDRGKASSSYDYTAKFYESPIFHYALIALVIMSLAVSTAALVYTSQLKKALVPRTINADDFLKKLTSHNEMKAYVGVAPLNIIQITNSNLANLQSQVSGLDASYIGSFILQYNDRIVIYDYDKDAIRGTVGFQRPQAQLPPDFSLIHKPLSKLLRASSLRLSHSLNSFFNSKYFSMLSRYNVIALSTISSSSNPRTFEASFIFLSTSFEVWICIFIHLQFLILAYL